MNINKYFILLVSFILVSSFALGGSAYILLYKNTPPQAESPILPSEQPSESWQTYASAQYGFSLQYPTQTVIKDVDVSGGRSITFQPPGSSGTVMVSVQDKAWYEGVLRAPGTCNYDSTTAKSIQGFSFLKRDASADFSGMNSRSSVTELCAIWGDVSYRIIIRTAGNDVLNSDPADNDPILNKIAESFTFNVLKIPELGASFLLPSELSDLTYVVVKLPTDQAVNTVGFSTKSLEDQGCDAKSAPLGYLTYSNVAGGEPIVSRKSGLYYLPPSGSCKADASLQQRLKDALKSTANPPA